MPNRPQVAVEVRAAQSRRGVARAARQAWGAALGDPATWAKAAEAAGADLIVLQFTPTIAAGDPMTGGYGACRRCAPC